MKTLIITLALVAAMAAPALAQADEVKDQCWEAAVEAEAGWQTYETCLRNFSLNSDSSDLPIVVDDGTVSITVHEVQSQRDVTHVLVSIENTLDETVSIYGVIDWEAIDAEGFTYSAAWFGGKEPSLQSADLQPGRTTKGWLTFETTSVESLLYDSTYTDDLYIDLPKGES